MAGDTLFKTAPKEVVEYFDRRPAVPTFDWRDIAPREHALAFTAAKTAGLDIVETIRDQVRKAVVDRQSWEAFRDELVPKLKAAGWWGERKLRDPATGELVKAELGSLRRLRIIHWANVHSAHAAGEWQRIERTKDFLPWLTYTASVSERKRPLHLSWVGTTLPVDDPWWRSHYPPNGWNCKCGVRQVADREAGRLHKRYGKDRAPPLDERPWTHKRTGATEMIPAGIDPGWQHNPGLHRDRTLSRGLQNALDRLPEPARKEAVATLARHPVAEHAASGTADPNFSAVVAMLPDQARRAIGAQSAIVRLSGSSARHALEHKEMSPALLLDAARRLDEGEVYIDGRSLIVFVPIDGELYRVVIKRIGDGAENYVTTVHRAEPRHLRRAAVKFDKLD